MARILQYILALALALALTALPVLYMGSPSVRVFYVSVQATLERGVDCTVGAFSRQTSDNFLRNDQSQQPTMTSTMTHSKTPPGLPSLPAELILLIAAALGPAVHNLASLLRTSRRFAALLSPMLVRCGVRTLDQRNGRSVLHWAAATGRDSLLRTLLANGAEADSVDRLGNTPLHSAVISASTATVTRLLAHGVNLGRRNADGWTALDLAAIAGNCHIAGVLLEHGANIVARSGGMLESTPFHYAVMLGHVSVAELFLAHGADLEVTDRAGINIAQKAAIAGQGSGHEGISRLLFRTAEEARAIVTSDSIAPFIPLVRIEIRSERRRMELLVRLEKRAARFCRVPVARRHPKCRCSIS